MDRFLSTRDITDLDKNQANGTNFHKKKPMQDILLGFYEKKSERVDKPSSVPRSPGAAIIYLGR